MNATTRTFRKWLADAYYAAIKQLAMIGARQVLRSPAEHVRAILGLIAISKGVRVRERLQSRLLVGTLVVLLLPRFVGAVIDLGIGVDVFRTFHNFSQAFGIRDRYNLQSLAVSLALALLAFVARAATPAAALCGGLVCFQVAWLGFGYPPSLLRSLIPAIALLVVLTSLATRFRRARKEASGIAEPRSGRRASQVIANLGIAALCGAFSDMHLPYVAYGVLNFAAIAALAEATADTISSEIGQGIAGPAFLITNLRRVPAGTDGAVSLAGTFAGVLGAAAVILAGLPRPFGSTTPLLFTAALIAALAGLFFDSLLGATLERRGWLGNDLVNFFSTAVAALVSWPLVLLALHNYRACN
jgi:uncharacterized protein (TIGR00297 family)